MLAVTAVTYIHLGLGGGNGGGGNQAATPFDAKNIKSCEDNTCAPQVGPKKQTHKRLAALNNAFLRL